MPTSEKEKQCNYTSADQMMVQSLLMLGHKALTVTRNEVGGLVYVFDRKEVEEHVNLILTGHAEELQTNLAAFRRAQDTWIMNLRNIR